MRSGLNCHCAARRFELCVHTRSTRKVKTLFYLQFSIHCGADCGLWALASSLRASPALRDFNSAPRSPAPALLALARRVPSAEIFRASSFRSQNSARVFGVKWAAFRMQKNSRGHSRAAFVVAGQGIHPRKLVPSHRRAGERAMATRLVAVIAMAMASSIARPGTRAERAA